MDLKDMILEVVYETKDGLFPLEISARVEKRFNTHVQTLEVERIVDKNPKLFLERDGKIVCPSDLMGVKDTPVPGIKPKDMVVEIIYEAQNGLFPLEILEAIEKRFGAHITFIELKRILQKNPRLFIEEEGKIKRPN